MKCQAGDVVLQIVGFKREDRAAQRFDSQAGYGFFERAFDDLKARFSAEQKSGDGCKHDQHRGCTDEKSFGEYVAQHAQTIVNFFTRAEMNRQMRVLETSYNDYVYTEVKKMFDCEVWVPGALSSHKSGDHFFWAGTNTATGDQNFVIYSFPYTDPKTFTKEFFLHKRDSVMKINIPGAREGMYMATDTAFTNVEPIAVQNKYALEARGLWRIKNDFMGGPFVSHMRLDTINQRIVVSEVFVYSPDKMKRNLIRQMEASLYTVRLPRAAAQDTVKIGKGNDVNQ